QKDAERYAGATAGLKAIQIASILAPPPAPEAERAEREVFITGLLGGGPGVKERAARLSTLTAGLSKDEIHKLLAPESGPPADPAATVAERARHEAERLIMARKREI